MNPYPFQINRFFVCPQYSLYYRRLKNFNWANEARPDYGVLLLLEGQLSFKTGETRGEMTGGQSLLIRPSVGASAVGQTVELLLLALAPAFVMDRAVRMRLIGRGATVAFQRALVEPDERLNQLARGIASELTEDKPGGEIVVAALVEQIVVQLLRHYANMRRSEELEFSRAGLVDRRIRRSIELMHAQLDTDLSLKDIAAASYISPFHFARVFKKLTGATPHAYLAGIRTTRAQSLLAEADLSVTEISSMVGYSSPSNFTKAFRDATGLTPRAFRKALVAR